MRIVMAVVLTALVLLALRPVNAQEYVSDAAAALEQSSVYVAPETEGTDQNTAARLEARLNKGDNIVLVMLPTMADEELGVDTITIAMRLSDELENKRIIGLAVGNEVVAYAPILPAGVAADQMRRAGSVSNDPITALGTFVQNIHIWQRENLEPIPQPPLETQEEGGSPLGVYIVAVASVTFIIIALWAADSGASGSSTRERKSFRAPDQVKDLLAKIVRERVYVHDPELKQVLYQMCVDIERYFSKSSRDKKKDSFFFRDRLTEVFQVLEKYIEVQSAPRYYNDPEEHLERGRESIKDFAHYVLESIRRGNAADLFDYKVNTNILQAQRYR